MAKPLVRRLTVLTCAAAAMLSVAAGTAGAVVTRTGSDSAVPYVNPVAGYPWGIYQGASDGLYPAYEAAHGTTKKLLGKEALRPHVRWYTGFIPAGEVAGKVSADIAAEQQGNPLVMDWMATFDLWPHGEAAKMQPMTAAQQAAFRNWVNHVARGIGNSRVAVIVEPDLPVVQKGWRPSVRLALVRYEVRTYAALPNTVVYLDGGSSDWRHLKKEIPMLRAAGIRWAHGFSLGATHHPRLAQEIRYGRTVTNALAQDGIAGKHFIVDTSDNGHGYTWSRFYAKYPNGDYNNPPWCTTATQRVCVSLGVPPTTDVANPRWQLPPRVAQTAKRWVDAYMWIARPWMSNNGEQFNLAKATSIVRTSPFAND